jgi:hypothetical protein
VEAEIGEPDGRRQRAARQKIFGASAVFIPRHQTRPQAFAESADCILQL